MGHVIRESIRDFVSQKIVLQSPTAHLNFLLQLISLNRCDTALTREDAFEGIQVCARFAFSKVTGGIKRKYLFSFGFDEAQCRFGSHVGRYFVFAHMRDFVKKNIKRSLRRTDLTHHPRDQTHFRIRLSVSASCAASLFARHSELSAASLRYPQTPF